MNKRAANTRTGSSESKLLKLIVDAPGVYGAELPRSLRKSLKALELDGLIVYGPSGWIPTEAGNSRATEAA